MSSSLWKVVRAKGLCYAEVSLSVELLRLEIKLVDSPDEYLSRLTSRKASNCTLVKLDLSMKTVPRIGIRELLKNVSSLRISLRAQSIKLGVTWVGARMFVASIIPLLPHARIVGENLGTNLPGILSAKIIHNKNVNLACQAVVLATSGCIKIGPETLSRLYSVLGNLVGGKVIEAKDEHFLANLTEKMSQGFEVVESLLRKKWQNSEKR
jgi:hypothetical protein